MTTRYRVAGEVNMGDSNGKKVEVAGVMGPVWFIGWLFTIGFVHLPFWKAVLAILIWPYYLGAALA
jgi:hypothetical protein